MLATASFSTPVSTPPPQVLDPPPQSEPYVIVTGYDSKASLTLSGAIPPGQSVSMNITLKNMGGAAASGNIGFKVFATADGAIDAGSILLSVPALAAVAVNLAAGASVTLNGVWNVPQMMPEGRYELLVETTGDSNLGLSAALTTPLVIAPTIQILWGFGGDTPASAVPLVEDLGNGDVVTFSLTGGGIGFVFPDDPDTTLGPQSPDFQVVLYSTTMNSSLAITQTGTTRPNIVDITFGNGTGLGSADLRQDTPHDIALGSYDQGAVPVGTLMIGQLPLAAPRSAPAGTAPSEPGSVTVYGTVQSFLAPMLNGDVSITGSDFITPMSVSIETLASGVSFQTTQPIESMTLGSAAVGSSVQAYYLGSLTTTGDFDASLTLLGQPKNGTPALGMMQIGGSVNGNGQPAIQWNIGGNVGRIHIGGDAINLQLFAGAALNEDDTTGSTTPPVFDYSAATISNLSVAGHIYISTIAAGYDPGTQTVLRDGQIQAISVGQSIDSATHFFAAALASITGPRPVSTGEHLVWLTQPVTIVAGGRLGTITLELQDDNGHPVASENSLVSLTIATGPGTGSTLATAQFKNGIALFKKLSLKIASFYSLEAGDGDLPPALSGNFTVLPGKPSRMVLLDLTPAYGFTAYYYGDVKLVDRYGNLVTSDTSNLGLKPIPKSNPCNLSLFGVQGFGAAHFENGMASFRMSMIESNVAHADLLYANRSVRPLLLPPIDTWK